MRVLNEVWFAGGCYPIRDIVDIRTLFIEKVTGTGIEWQTEFGIDFRFLNLDWNSTPSVLPINEGRVGLLVVLGNFHSKF